VGSYDAAKDSFRCLCQLTKKTCNLMTKSIALHKLASYSPAQIAELQRRTEDDLGGRCPGH
jgi:hypothetical protein